MYMPRPGFAGQDAPRRSVIAFAAVLMIVTQGRGVAQQPQPGEPLVVTSPTILPVAVVDQSYQHILSAAGGQPPYTWQISGSLPSGLSLDPATGQVVGVSPQVEDSSFTAVVTDQAGGIASKNLYLLTSLDPQPLVGDGAAGALQQTVVFFPVGASDFPPFACQRTSGTLPPGLTLVTFPCDYSGRPTTPGVFRWMLISSASNGVTSRENEVIHVILPPLQIVTPGVLPVGVVGEPYSVQLDAEGARPPYEWSVIAGSPPPGVKLDMNGSLSGTTTTAGTFYFTAQVMVSGENVPWNAFHQRQFLLSASDTAFQISAPSLGIPVTVQQDAPPQFRSARLLGTEAFSFQAEAQTDLGGNWLAVSPTSGQVTLNSPVTLEVRFDPAGLAPGSYTGRIIVTNLTTGTVEIIPVTLVVQGAGLSLFLSSSGTVFTAVEGAAFPQSRIFEIRNGGAGSLEWTLATSTLSGGDWLSAEPASGTASDDSPSSVEIRVNPAGLAAGEYYGQVDVMAPDVDNSPQTLLAVLRVFPPDVNPGPDVNPTGLIFVGEPGESSPQSQIINVANNTLETLTFSSNPFFPDLNNWFTVEPEGGTLNPGESVMLKVVANTEGFVAGVFPANLDLIFPEANTISRIALLLVLAPGAGANTATLRDGVRLVGQNVCAPTRLLPVFTQLGRDFRATVGLPHAVDTSVVDDCGRAMNSGSVAATFSNGDPPLLLQPLGEGRWAGTWSARNPSESGVTITVEARLPGDPPLEGSAQIDGALDTEASPPVLGGAVSAVSFARNQPQAHGSLVAIFGTRLAQETSLARDVPLPTQLGETQVVLAGRRLPLLFASEAQVNAAMLFDLSPNTTYQLLVRRGNTLSAPEPFTVVTTQPAIFSKDSTGRGQGLIERVAADQSRSFAEPGTPARPGEALVIYCSGLGPVDPPVQAGAAAPFSPLSVTVEPVRVTLGGVEATVFFSGLTPGFVGLYQVNAFVPAEASTGDAVPVVVSIEGKSSSELTIAIAGP